MVKIAAVAAAANPQELLVDKEVGAALFRMSLYMLFREKRLVRRGHGAQCRKS
jgi:hypothetical protein